MAKRWHIQCTCMWRVCICICIIIYLWYLFTCRLIYTHMHTHTFDPISCLGCSIPPVVTALPLSISRTISFTSSPISHTTFTFPLLPHTLTTHTHHTHHRQQLLRSHTHTIRGKTKCTWYERDKSCSRSRACFFSHSTSSLKLDRSVGSNPRPSPLRFRFTTDCTSSWLPWSEATGKTAANLPRRSGWRCSSTS